MILPPVGPYADTSARLLALPFEAMLVTASDVEPFTHGMPSTSYRVSGLNLVIGATVCAQPMFRDTVARVALTWRQDVVLVRTGLFAEAFDSVTVDVAVVGGDVLVVHDMSFYRHHNQSLWLVTRAGGPMVLLDEGGLELRIEPPFTDADERADGVSRAASELARIALKRGR
jgi:hypothetical protein